jgi:nitroimidazol reductase NimA-like FMN-containing flavoprotein (pyridoxamine 5'-phosphate oxidase superfamily)
MPDTEARTMLARGYAGRLATVGADGGPYVVPLLYVWADGEIWAHSASVRGHLRTNLEHEARVCFEIDEAGEAFPYGRFECDTALAYRSVVAFGRVRIVDDAALKTRFFERFMAKYADPAWGRPAGFFPRLDQVTVYAIAIERLTGKQAMLPTPANRWPAMDRTMSPNAVPPA